MPRRAVGELRFCPPCVGQWTAAGFLGGLLWAPRVTRSVASLFAVQGGLRLPPRRLPAGRDRA